MSHDFNVGDRVRSLAGEDSGLAPQWRDVTGTVIEDAGNTVRVCVDGKHQAGYGITFNTSRIQKIVDPGPSKAEVAELFGLRPGAPGPDSTLIELLENIDDTLRNGRLMTRANLAFEYLLRHLELRRTDLPSYVADMNRLDEEDR